MGAVALLLVIALVGAAVVVLGRTGSDAAQGSGGARSSAASQGAERRESAATASTIDVGNCGPIPEVTPLPGPDEPGLLVTRTSVESMAVTELERLYGTLRVTDARYFSTVEQFATILDVPDLAARVAALEAAGFRGAAQRHWLSARNDSVDILLVALADPEHARVYAQAHLRDVCTAAWNMAPSVELPGAVTYESLTPEGRPQVRLIALVGNTEVNVALCTCEPGDASLAAAERWAGSLVRTLQSERA